MMTLVEVNDAKTRKEFLAFPAKLYQNDHNYIRPLDNDIEAVFDPTKNAHFKNGDAKRWLLTNEKGQTIGKVAAFYDLNTASKGNEQPTGAMGFFDCIDDKNAAFMLFDACKKWLQNKGLEAMDGPVNFGDRSQFWGLLIEGFDPPSYCMNYNLTYYKAFFEEYGFKNYFEQYTYKHIVGNPMIGEEFYQKLKRLTDRGYVFKHIEKKNVAKYGEEFRQIYNASWVKHLGVAEISKEEAQALILKMKPIIDEKIVWFAYYNSEPIGFFIMLPELNAVVKRIKNGSMGLIGTLKFIYYMMFKKVCNQALGIIVGVLPRYQGRGVESAIFAAFGSVAYKPEFPYRSMVFNWVGDFLPSMSAIYESIGCTIARKHITFRKLFDETKPFTRHPVLK